MAKSDEPTDDLHSGNWARMGAGAPGDPPAYRFDYGDAAQRAEMDAVPELPPDEPAEMVDAPIALSKPFSRADKQRNQRRLPT